MRIEDEYDRGVVEGRRLAATELQTLRQRNAELESANETAQWCVRDKNQQILSKQLTIEKMREALLLIKQRASACGHQPMYKIAIDALSLQPSTAELAKHDEVIRVEEREAIENMLNDMNANGKYSLPDFIEAIRQRKTNE